MQYHIYGIDPGAGGAVAHRFPDGTLTITKGPFDPEAIIAFCQSIDPARSVVGIELVGLTHGGRADPRMSETHRLQQANQRLSQSSGTYKLRDEWARWQQTLLVMGVPTVNIPPHAWMSAVAPDRPRGEGAYRKRKQYMAEVARRLYEGEGVKVTLLNADALCILTYMQRNPDKWRSK